jgi:hypothetical protein
MQVLWREVSAEDIHMVFKTIEAGCWWVMPETLSFWEAEINQ